MLPCKGFLFLLDKIFLFPTLLINFIREDYLKGKTLHFVFVLCFITVFNSTAWAQDKAGWFDPQKTNILIGILITLVLVFGYTIYGKKKGELKIRPIPGLEALDEAVGRATEMGKPILFTSGLGKMERVATMASMNILGSVAERVAEYNTPIIIPNYDPVVTTVAQEVVKESFTRAGHPESYKKENIYFVTQSQFGYVAAVDGIMMREKPATNLLLGTFEAESLILAETGNSIGALQIAGTDSTIQLSFFIVACDYTLIGEELFAASGYLTKDPLVLGSIRGQDILKLIIALLVIAGGIFSTFGSHFVTGLFG
ncbi:MAG: hypothetical protein OEV55_07545 [candidate division Zixibacteria bacterium]|nr:hypothetical protein [candidate division Zixibacteria bacterium]